MALHAFTYSKEYKITSYENDIDYKKFDHRPF